jgi:hypothetical protein
MMPKIVPIIKLGRQKMKSSDNGHKGSVSEVVITRIIDTIKQLIIPPIIPHRISKNFVILAERKAHGSLTTQCT